MKIKETALKEKHYDKKISCGRLDSFCCGGCVDASACCRTKLNFVLSFFKIIDKVLEGKAVFLYNYYYYYYYFFFQ